MDPVLGFLSGVGVSLVGALVANLLSRFRERQKIADERRFNIYMKLMELYGSYFWFTTAEVHRETVSAEIRQKCQSLAWQITDMLRQADGIEFLDQILDVLLGSGFTTAVKRYEAMGQVLDKLGTRINPCYTRKIREISDSNIQMLASGGSSNAPGATWP